MQYYNLSFPEAVEKLALQYGVTIREDSSDSVYNKAPYYEINKNAASFFWNVMKSSDNPGRKYMLDRGISAKTMQTFGIGYADEEWQSLTDTLLQGGADRDLLVQLGLSSVSGKNGKLYDKFRGRVMFPIIDTRKHVIGFGGRIIGDGEPKYLNSQESEVFLKKNNLYGLNLSRTAIQQEGYAILVEGYMDVVSLYQSGVHNVAASLGTALTENQARLLKKYTKKIVLCYDSDAAGIKAALRGIDVLRSQGLEVRVLNVVDAKDPDEYIKKYGKDSFIQLVREKSIPDIEYKIRNIGQKYNVSDTTQGIRYLKAVANVLKDLSPVEADIYIRQTAKQSGISEGALRREVSGERSSPDFSVYSEKSEKENTGPMSNKGEDGPALRLERTLLRLILQHSDYWEIVDQYPEFIVSSEGQEIIDLLSENYKEGVDFDLTSLKNKLNDEASSYIDDIYAAVIIADDKATYDDCIYRLRVNRINERIHQLQDALDLLGEDDISRADQIMKELMQLQKEKKQIKR